MIFKAGDSSSHGDPTERYLAQQCKEHHFPSPNEGHPYRNIIRVINERQYIMIQVIGDSINKV